MCNEGLKYRGNGNSGTVRGQIRIPLKSRLLSLLGFCSFCVFCVCFFPLNGHSCCFSVDTPRGDHRSDILVIYALYFGL